MRYYITGAGVPDPGAFKVETRDALNQLELDSRPFLAQATNRPSQAVKDSNDVYYSGKAVTTQVNHCSSILQYRDFLNPTVMSTKQKYDSNGGSSQLTARYMRTHLYPVAI